MPANPIEVKASRITRISTVNEIMAARWRKNRRRTSCAWVRATIAMPWAWVLGPSVPVLGGSVAVPGVGVAGSPVGLDSVLTPPPFRRTLPARSPRNGCRHDGADCSLGKPRSCQPNPWIEEAVDDVGRQVGQHDRQAGDQEEPHDGVGVRNLERVDEVPAHAYPAEHGFGDDGAAYQSADVQRDDGGDRNH